MLKRIRLCNVEKLAEIYQCNIIELRWILKDKKICSIKIKDVDFYDIEDFAHMFDVVMPVIKGKLPLENQDKKEFNNEK